MKDDEDGEDDEDSEDDEDDENGNDSKGNDDKDHQNIQMLTFAEGWSTDAAGGSTGGVALRTHPYVANEAVYFISSGREWAAKCPFLTDREVGFTTSMMNGTKKVSGGVLWTTQRIALTGTIVGWDETLRVHTKNNTAFESFQLTDAVVRKDEADEAVVNEVTSVPWSDLVDLINAMTAKIVPKRQREKEAENAQLELDKTALIAIKDHALEASKHAENVEVADLFSIEVKIEKKRLDGSIYYEEDANGTTAYKLVYYMTGSGGHADDAYTTAWSALINSDAGFPWFDVKKLFLMHIERVLVVNDKHNRGFDGGGSEGVPQGALSYKDVTDYAERRNMERQNMVLREKLLPLTYDETAKAIRAAHMHGAKPSPLVLVDEEARIAAMGAPQDAPLRQEEVVDYAKRQNMEHDEAVKAMRAERREKSITEYYEKHTASYGLTIANAAGYDVRGEPYTDADFDNDDESDDGNDPYELTTLLQIDHLGENDIEDFIYRAATVQRTIVRTDGRKQRFAVFRGFEERLNAIARFVPLHLLHDSDTVLLHQATMVLMQEDLSQGGVFEVEADELEGHLMNASRFVGCDAYTAAHRMRTLFGGAAAFETMPYSIHEEHSPGFDDGDDEDDQKYLVMDFQKLTREYILWTQFMKGRRIDAQIDFGNFTIMPEDGDESHAATQARFESMQSQRKLLDDSDEGHYLSKLSPEMKIIYQNFVDTVNGTQISTPIDPNFPLLRPMMYHHDALRLRRLLLSNLSESKRAEDAYQLFREQQRLRPELGYQQFFKEAKVYDKDAALLDWQMHRFRIPPCINVVRADQLGQSAGPMQLASAAQRIGNNAEMVHGERSDMPLDTMPGVEGLTAAAAPVTNRDGMGAGAASSSAFSVAAATISMQSNGTSVFESEWLNASRQTHDTGDERNFHESMAQDNKLMGVTFSKSSGDAKRIVVTVRIFCIEQLGFFLVNYVATSRIFSELADKANDLDAYAERKMNLQQQDYKDLKMVIRFVLLCPPRESNGEGANVLNKTAFENYMTDTDEYAVWRAELLYCTVSERLLTARASSADVRRTHDLLSADHVGGTEHDPVVSQSFVPVGDAHVFAADVKDKTLRFGLQLLRQDSPPASPTLVGDPVDITVSGPEAALPVLLGTSTNALVSLKVPRWAYGDAQTCYFTWHVVTRTRVNMNKDAIAKAAKRAAEKAAKKAAEKAARRATKRPKEESGSDGHNAKRTTTSAVDASVDIRSFLSSETATKSKNKGPIIDLQKAARAAVLATTDHISMQLRKAIAKAADISKKVDEDTTGRIVARARLSGSLPLTNSSTCTVAGRPTLFFSAPPRDDSAGSTGAVDVRVRNARRTARDFTLTEKPTMGPVVAPPSDTYEFLDIKGVDFKDETEHKTFLRNIKHAGRHETWRDTFAHLQRSFKLLLEITSTSAKDNTECSDVVTVVTVEAAYAIMKAYTASTKEKALYELHQETAVVVALALTGLRALCALKDPRERYSVLHKTLETDVFYFAAYSHIQVVRTLLYGAMMYGTAITTEGLTPEARLVKSIHQMILWHNTGEGRVPNGATIPNEALLHSRWEGEEICPYPGLALLNVLIRIAFVLHTRDVVCADV
jgi:Arc/MetJ family transcription regulator